MDAINMNISESDPEENLDLTSVTKESVLKTYFCPESEVKEVKAPQTSEQFEAL
jgi:hypothetical protein